MEWLVIGIFLILYFLPTIIAVNKERESVGAIFALNLFLGWTLIGWVVSLSWSLKNPSRVEMGQVREYADKKENKNQSDNKSIAEEIKKLHQLKVDGILTEEEFKNMKSRLLEK